MFFECSRIQSSFKKDNFNCPQSGWCKTELVENQLLLTLKRKKERLYFNDSENQLEQSVHLVSIEYKSSLWQTIKSVIIFKIHKHRLMNVEFADTRNQVKLFLFNGTIEISFVSDDGYRQMKTRTEIVHSSSIFYLFIRFKLSDCWSCTFSIDLSNNASTNKTWFTQTLSWRTSKKGSITLF